MLTASAPASFQQQQAVMRDYFARFGGRLRPSLYKFMVDFLGFEALTKRMQQSLDEGQPIPDLNGYAEQLAEGFWQMRREQLSNAQA